MNNKTLMLAAALSLTSLAGAQSTGAQSMHRHSHMAPHYNQQYNQAPQVSQRISYQYTGTVRGYNHHTYYLNASAGQRVRVKLQAPNLNAVLMGPGISDSVDLSDAQSYTLPASGRYELRVLQMRNDARKGRAQHYKLNIIVR